MKKLVVALLLLSPLFNNTIFSQNISESAYYNRLYYTCKVWGFLKYFHSEVAKGNINWDSALFSILNNVKANNTNDDFNQSIQNLINSAGNYSYANTNLPYVADSLKFNLNLSWFNDSIFSDSIKSQLNSISKKFRPEINYYVDEAFSEGNPIFETDNQFYEYGKDQFPGVEKRLLALFRYWNIINYFYPYKNIIDQDWDTTLVEFIPKVISASDSNSFNRVFLELATYLNDSHAFTGSKEIFTNILGSYFLPLKLKYVQNQTVITNILIPNSVLKVGDVIKSIDGIDIATLRDSLRKYVQGSNNAVINRNINSRIVSGKYGDVKLIISNDSLVKNITLTRNLTSNEYFSEIAPTGDIWKTIISNSKKYGYVDMGRLEKKQISQMFNDLWETDAIIFDIRNYPKGTMWYMVDYFFDNPINVANFTVPDVKYPGTLYWHSEFVGTYNTTPNYEKPIFILFDETTQSQAEYTIMAFEHHPKAIKIGSQTAGADGNVSKIYLPGGIYTYFTGLGTFYHDFTKTQRVGIKPDLEVLPTIDGIRNGKDEVLEAALNYDIASTKETTTGSNNKFFLSQNYPNPFNPNTIIRYSIPNNEFVTLKIYNILGKEIATLVNQKQSSGIYEVNFNASNLTSGIYFYQISTSKFNKVRKMMLLK